MKKISIIVPCYNEEEALQLYYREMAHTMNVMSRTESTRCEFELLFIDDGSSDATLEVMKKLQREDSRCRFLSFSRNFGKEAAIYAGLCKLTGDYVAIMDADLQDPPSLLPEMLRLLEEGGYDCVAARRSTRQGEPKLRSFLSDCFYRVINQISETEIVRGARDYRLMKRRMADAVLELSEYNRFSKGIFGWIGFRTKWLEYENQERCAGETKWSLKTLFFYSMEGITGFSTAPLSIASAAGILFCFLSLFIILIVMIRTIVWGDPVAGWPSLVCIIFFVGGVQLLCIGIMGQYLSKTYLETKRRPIYILKESSDDADSENVCVGRQA